VARCQQKCDVARTLRRTGDDADQSLVNKANNFKTSLTKFSESEEFKENFKQD